MTNIIPFPEIRVASNDHARYAFTSDEILTFVTVHLARQIVEPTTPSGLLAVGVTDEGDGWMYSQRENKKTGWSDMTPVARFEKDVSGVSGKFFQKIFVNGVEIRSSCMKGRKRLHDIMYERMTDMQKPIQSILYQVHLPVVESIANDVRNDINCRISIDRYAHNVLQHINHDAVERMHSLYAKNASSAADETASYFDLIGESNG